MIHGPIRVPLQWYNERRYVIRSVTSIWSLCLSDDWSVGCCIVGWSELSNYNFLSSSFSVCNFQINPFDSGENLFKSNWPSVCLERLIRGYYFFISWVKILIVCMQLYYDPLNFKGTAFFIADLTKTRVSDPHFFCGSGSGQKCSCGSGSRSWGYPGEGGVGKGKFFF